MPARAGVLEQNTTATVGQASNLYRWQSFKLTSDATITDIDLYIKNNPTIPFNFYVCITSTKTNVNNSSGCLSASYQIVSSVVALTWVNADIGDYNATAGTTYYIKIYLPNTNFIWNGSGSTGIDYYLNGCYYLSSSGSCYGGGKYDTNFKINGTVVPAQVCGNSIIEPPEYCDDRTAKNGFYYYGCNSTCNGYIINFMGIELINYMATSTAINASSTVIAGVYNSAFILYVFIFSITAILLFLVKLFFFNSK